jgi:dihydroanticapsin dehydrogenase
MNMSTKTALVSGGAMGYKDGGPSIGGAIALRLAKDGFQVVVVDVLEMGQRTADLIIEHGGSAMFIQADVTKDEQIQAAVARTEEAYGGLNCLVNCVARYGSGMAKNIADVSDEEWLKTLDVNLNGYFRMAKRCIPLILKSGGGTIINISSIETYTALPNFSVYSVAKGAVDAMTRTMALDFAPDIRTNSIAPGFVKIANSENGRSLEELSKWHAGIAKEYPMKRVCEVDEIASVASFLAGNDSSYINGQTIVVDGGKTIADMHEF